MEPTGRGLIVFSDITDLDPAPAEAALHGAGYSTLRLDLPTGAMRTGTPTLPPGAETAVGMIVGWARITPEVMDAFPDLKIIATCSVGTDMVDVETARRRNIAVLNLAGVASEEVASHALALILAAERGLIPGLQTVAKGGWTEEFSWRPRRLSELTLGLYGLGRIGAELARLAAPLFRDIVAYDPFVAAAPHGRVPAGVRLVDEARLLSASDVLSLHVPSTPATRGMVNEAFLARLQPSTIVCNVSRGDLVVEGDIRRALAAGSLRAYVADVLAVEPPQGAPELTGAPDVLLTPHIAFLSTTSELLYAQQPALSIIDYLK